MENMSIYKKFATTPKEAQKSIAAGRLKGMTDINPMWRIKMLTEQFGPVGFGWKLAITDTWTLAGGGEEVKAFAKVNLFIKVDGEWSEPIEGIGGSSFVSSEKNGLYTDDECFKKAVTDAIGSACKLLGMSADIYYANDRTKYTAPVNDNPNHISNIVAPKVTYLDLVAMLTPDQQIALEEQKGKPLEFWSDEEIAKTMRKIAERNSKNA